MKKIILIFLLLIPLKVKASAYIVMDTDNNRVIEGNNIHAPYLIASTSKIMTALVVINNTDIKNIIKINEEVLKSYGSGIYVKVGERISIEDLLYGLMLRSGNDAAIALADYIGGSMEGFSLMMNDTAKAIGMKNTNFINSHGLENNKNEGNMSTAYDMALLSSYAIQNDIYKKISGTKKHSVKTNMNFYLWHNKNKLLSSYKYCTGGKTGFTKLAKRTLVTTASKDNMNFTVVTFKDGNDFNNHQSYYEKAFKNHKSYTIYNKGNIETDLSNTYIEKDIKVTLTKSEFNRLKVDIKYNKQNVTKIVGHINLTLDGTELESVPILQKEKQEKKESFFKKFFRKIGLKWLI
ncbi:MAG TPA: D-alanyl-D-alanine carboxypeptidase [Mollicutes bacterium]|nr:D-alanyl-D-alanine carboxypeptidase [Mollicutes bacterium]